MSEAPPKRRRRPDNHEFGVARLRELPLSLPTCDTPRSVYDYWQANIASACWYNPDVECLCVLHLNTRRRATGFHLAGLGTLDTVYIHAREVFRTAIVRAAAAIVLAHNHPSGDPHPSQSDIKVTRELVRAGQLLRIEVLDHVIMGRVDSERSQGWESLRALGYLA